MSRMERRLPATIAELERIELELELLRRNATISHLRQAITQEELEQQSLRRVIEERLGPLHREIEQLKAEVNALEARLRRLLRASRPLSDSELDAQAAQEHAEEAAWRAEFRAQQSARETTQGRLLGSANGHDDVLLRRLYRTLARLIHPDLAQDGHDRAQREAIMRIVNQAREAGDVDQLRRLLAIWAREDDGDRPYDIEALRSRVAQRGVECAELRQQLQRLRRSDLGHLLAKGRDEVERYLRHREVTLRRELAVQRLRRRRVLRLIEERRLELSRRADAEARRSS
uniref:Molecular chaperone DnaJ n=1 Tax=Thermorudis peleae TaxID=1382356 RepID=A0A831TJN2_9BACT